VNAIITAGLLGLSVDGLVLCPFFAFGLSLSDRYAALRFLWGRIFGLVLFGIAVTQLGRVLPIRESFVNIAFGAVLFALGVQRIISSRSRLKFLTKRRPGGPLGLGCGKSGSRKIGFGLGLLRGFLNPGRKYIYLAPLLLSVGLLKGVALSFAFSVTSSTYLIIGFLSAGLLEKLTPHKRLIGLSGGMVLSLLGIIYSFRGITMLR